MSHLLEGKTILVTGGAKRVGKIFALACARAKAVGLNFSLIFLYQPFGAYWLYEK